MIKYFASIVLIVILLLALFLFLKNRNLANNYYNSQDILVPSTSDNISIQNNSVLNNNPTGFVSPLDRASERVTKKPFGIFITSQNSPIQPENFFGFHTGTDFEIFPEELNIDVSVKAVCTGKIKMKKYATGYGGVLVEDCMLDGNPITVIYGHLKLASIQKNLGDNFSTGEVIGILGADRSVETSDERKHLHLGFHNGKSLNILGYVQNKSELSEWLDPCLYVCQ